MTYGGEVRHAVLAANTPSLHQNLDSRMSCLNEILTGSDNIDLIMISCPSSDRSGTSSV